ncbi:MAG: hypothetical protein KO254_01230 [Methanoculleus marisnigri]|nr:hypothetical protein [Methanoculleus marisnigri]
MSKQIEVKEAIVDKNSDFNIKRFKLGKLNIEKPIKAIDAKNITQSVFEAAKPDVKSTFFETSKNIDSDTLQKVSRETNDSKIKEIFGYKGWIAEYENAISLTLNFDPFRVGKNLERYFSGFFDYYYNFSKTVSLVPSIKVTQNLYTEGKNGNLRKVGEEKIIHFEDYTRFVEESFQILDYKNKKPIFVPLSLRMDIDDIRRLAKTYLKREFFHIWVDYEGATAADLTKLSRLRAFYRTLDESERFEDVIVYSTNIRREITSNKKMNCSPSSDVLTTISGANIIGINREPSFGGNRPPMTDGEKMQIRAHKARIFDPDSYYYIKSDVPQMQSIDPHLFDPKRNMLLNANLLNFEFQNQANHFLDSGTIQEYISQKSMLNEYKSGTLKKRLFQKKSLGKQTTIDDYFVPI